jgi:ATP-dependent Clp protease adaptor protein ClpS
VSLPNRSDNGRVAGLPSLLYIDITMSNGPEKQQNPQHEVDVLDEELTITVPRYHVVLLDDNHHTYDYVIEMLMDIFGHSRETAYEMACEVDARGRVIVHTTYKERAEMKRDQVMSYGADWRIPHCKGSMSAIIEPAD